MTFLTDEAHKRAYKRKHQHGPICKWSTRCDNRLIRNRSIAQTESFSTEHQHKLILRVDDSRAIVSVSTSKSQNGTAQSETAHVFFFAAFAVMPPLANLTSGLLDSIDLIDELILAGKQSIAAHVSLLLSNNGSHHMFTIPM